MMAFARTRADLFSMVSERLTATHTEDGISEANQLKVFWLEVNARHHPSPLVAEGWIAGEENFFVHPGTDGTAAVWLDTSDPRIWYVYTFAGRTEVRRLIKRDLLPQAGVDRVWLAETFLEKVRRQSGYEGRGFGLRFRDALVAEETERPRISGKFWVGRNVPPLQRQFLKSAEAAFSKSSIRLGRPPIVAGTGSGALLELYSEGAMTVTTSDDPEETIGFIRSIGEMYSRELTDLEGRRQARADPVEFEFGSAIDPSAFEALVDAGVGKTRLWLQKYETDGELRRYTGVDLHTHEHVNLDMAPTYGYLVVQKSGCMNAAPRLMTLSAQNLSGKTEMLYEGVPLFA